MRLEKNMANHDSTRSAYEYCNGDTIDITEDQKEDNSRIEKRIADYIKVLRPTILVAADESIFEHKLLADLQGKYHRATPKPTIASLIDDVLRTKARTIVLVDPPIALDAGEVSRKTRCFVLTVRGVV